MDRMKGVGHELYASPNHTLKISTELLIGFIQALLLLGEEFGESKGDLEEVELGKYQISLMAQDHLVYVVIHDTFDSEPFTAGIIDRVINKYHHWFVNFNFNHDMDDETDIFADIAQMLQTMDFPMDQLSHVAEFVDLFLTETNWITDTLLLSDLDAGIVKIYQEPKDDPIATKLMEIMSEIPFERHWIGETKLFHGKEVNGMKDYEAWFIYRVGLTDFCILGRAFLAAYSERELLINRLEELTQQVLQIIIKNEMDPSR
jgi:hypothetical protein